MRQGGLMLDRPPIESAISHGGDKARVAAWVLDCLDQNPPSAGGDLTIYLCYSSSDINCFGSASRSEDMAEAIYGAYQQEQQWDQSGFEDLRFDLCLAPRTSQLSLVLRDGFAGGIEPMVTDSAFHDSRPQVLIEFCWQQSDMQIGPGMIGLVQAWRRKLDLDSDLRAVLVVKSGASISRHIDRWQRGARWHQPEIYLPAGRTDLLLGPWVGCDLYAPELQHMLLISYDSQSDEWNWRAAGGPNELQGCQHSRMSIDQPLAGGRSRLALSGEAFPTPRSLRSQNESNHLPLHSLDIVGFALPVAYAYGSDDDPDDPKRRRVSDGLPASVVELASSALCLPDGAVLYMERGSGRVFHVAKGTPPAGPLKDGDEIKLNTTAGGDGYISAEWRESTTLPPGFYGELVLRPAIDCLLARGVVSEDVPEGFFPDFRDITLGRAPLRLESRDGRHYSLVFNQSARQPVFVMAGDHSEFHRYDPVSVVPLAPRIGRSVVAKFILGSTHYQLREVAEKKTELWEFEPSFAPVGGLT